MALQMIGLLPDEALQEKITSFRQMYRVQAEAPFIAILSQKQIAHVAGIRQKLQSFCMAQSIFSVTVTLAQSVQSGLMLTTIPGKLNLFYDKLSGHLGVEDAPKLFRGSLTLIDSGGGIDLAAAYIEARKMFAGSITFEVECLALYETARDGQPLGLLDTFEFTGR